MQGTARVHPDSFFNSLTTCLATGERVSTAEALDIAWILVAAALVMFMQAGFSSLESGSVRTKNSINVAAKNFADFGLTTAVFQLA